MSSTTNSKAGTSLLPPNRTRFESALSAACAPPELTPEIIATLWDPARCPSPLLPWLAWTLSVDEWRSTWPEAAQRQAIADSAAIHRRKGTVWAVKRVLSTLNISCDIAEWWQTAPPGQPHTFQLVAWANENLTGEHAILTGDLYAMLKRMVDDTKPVRSHYGFKVGARFDDGLAVASASQIAAVGRWPADAVAVQPPPAANPIQVAGAADPQALGRWTGVPAAVQPPPAAHLLRAASAARSLTVIRISMEAR